MKIFSRKKNTDINDDHYDADEVFEKHYENFAASVRGEVNIGSEDYKQLEYTLHDGSVYILRTVAENVVFASPSEYVNLTWAVSDSSRVSHIALPVLSALKDADSLIQDFADFNDRGEATQRTAELLSSFTFQVIRHLDAIFDQVKTIRSSFVMEDRHIAETAHLKNVGQLPIEHIDEALNAVYASEVELFTQLGFDQDDDLQQGEITVFDEQELYALARDDNAIDITLRGLLVENTTITLSALQEQTQGILWRDVLTSVVKLFAEDIVDVHGGTINTGLPDVDGIFEDVFDISDLADSSNVIQGEVVDINDDITDDVKAVEGIVVENTMFDHNDDGGFGYDEILEEEFGFTTSALEDTLLTYDAQRVLRDSGESGRVYDRSIRFLQENDRLERELSALEESISSTRAELKKNKEHYGDLALNRELYGSDDNVHEYLHQTKDAVHQIYFTLAEKEEDRNTLNSARYEVLSEVHEVFEKLHSDGVQDILNRIENKMLAIEQASNVAYQSEKEEAEEVIASTHNALTHDNLLETPLFDRLMKERKSRL